MDEPTKHSGALKGVTGVGPGDVVGDKYEIERVLGIGGMGVVFLARHRELGGLSALKFLSAECLASPQAVARFRREAQAAAKLKSEHVVRVFDVGTHTNGLPYMVMEYLEGGDLARLIRHMGPLPIERAVDLVIQTCSAVAEAHREGIVHRDLKPSNLFCVTRADGSFQIKVVDFGISKVSWGAPNIEQGITATGNVMGSPSYMSPEQMKGASKVDHRTDIWSLGVVLYESLTGRLPFPADTYAEICLKVHQEPPIQPTAHRADIPPALEAVILKCLEKDPSQRFQSAAELAEALLPFASLATRTPVEAPPDALARSAKSIFGVTRTSTRSLATLTQPSWVRTASSPKNRRRSRLLTAAAAAAATTIAVSVVWLLVREPDVRTHTSSAVPSRRPDAPEAPATSDPTPSTTPPSITVAQPLVLPSPDPGDTTPPGESSAPSAKSTAPPGESVPAPLAPWPKDRADRSVTSASQPVATPLAPAAKATPATSAGALRTSKPPPAATARTQAAGPTPPATAVPARAPTPHVERDPKSSVWSR